MHIKQFALAGMFGLASLAVAGCGTGGESGSSTAGGDLTEGATAKPIAPATRIGEITAADAVALLRSVDQTALVASPLASPATEGVPNASVQVRVTPDVTDGVSMIVSDGSTVTIVPADRSESSAARLKSSAASMFLDDAVMYANARVDSDVAFHFSLAGAQATIQLRSPSSPRSFGWSVRGERVTSLVHGEDGSVAIAGAAGTIVRALSPSATDANGAQVPVSTDITGDTLSVTVQPSEDSVAYPIVVHQHFVDESQQAAPILPADSAWCTGPVSRPGMNIFDIDTTSLHHIRWGAQWSPAATYGVRTLSSIGYQYINNNATDQTYSKANVYPQYTFHSAIDKYKIVGRGSKEYEVHRNDYYQLFFQSTGNGFYGYATRGCWVG